MYSEIKLAVKLFWCVDISSIKMMLEFDFYDRFFMLTDFSCTTSDCVFSDTSNSGSCTATGEILSYYEILGILNQNSSISSIHDITNAVMYFIFNKNQWVFFDNKDIFQQKMNWTNDVELKDAMIWTSDLDVH